MKPHNALRGLIFATTLACCTLFLAEESLAFYNPSTGRWISRDPIEEGGGINLYAFLSGDPVGQADHLGLAFYAIGGTWENANDRANPWQLYMTTGERPKQYWHGPGFDWLGWRNPVWGGSGLQSLGIAKRVKDQICSDYCDFKRDGKTMPINLTGWSRGAIIASGVAKMLNDLGCQCGGICGFFATTHKPVQVNWIGLFDACAMMPTGSWWPATVPGNVSHFDHAIKTKHSGKMHMFPTWHFSGSNERAFNNGDGSLTTHADIGMSMILGNHNDAYPWIKSQAIAAGVAF